MTPIFSSFATASIRGFGRLNKGASVFLYNAEQLITTVGAGSWTKPEGVTSVQIECWGGGGAGGGTTLNNAGGGGGGGGGYAKKILTYSSTSASISYSVGSGGTGSTADGGNGSDTTWNTSDVIARAGTGGLAGQSGSSAGISGGDVESGATANVGDVVYRGGRANSGAGAIGINPNGAGGGGAGSLGAGGDASQNAGEVIGGVGTLDNGGNGGDGTTTLVNLTGIIGGPYGGGGGGAFKVSGASRVGGSGGQGLIRIRYFSDVPTPEYWWRADSGLTTSTWTASAGGLDFTLFNVTSANSTTGLTLNGTTSYGLTGDTATNIDAKHIFIRSDSISGTAGQTILGGTQNNIHEWYFTNVLNDWYTVENLAGGLTYASQSGALGSTITWMDFVNGAAPTYYLNTNETGTATTVYAGVYNNRLRWEAGFGIYVGRRGSGNYVSGSIKEIAIFTTSLTVAQAKSFRASMAARWP